MSARQPQPSWAASRDRREDRSVAEARPPAQRHGAISLAARFAGHGLLNLSLDGFKIKTRARLHRWKVDGRLSKCPNDVLHECEAPELEGKPFVIVYRTVVFAIVHSSTFKRIEA